MEILDNTDTNYEWLKNIPSGECFRNKYDEGCYMKTLSSKEKDCVLYDENGEHNHEDISYGYVDLSTGMLFYSTNVKVIPVHATVLINHNSEDK